MTDTYPDGYEEGEIIVETDDVAISHVESDKHDEMDYALSGINPDTEEVEVFLFGEHEVDGLISLLSEL